MARRSTSEGQRARSRGAGNPSWARVEGRLRRHIPDALQSGGADPQSGPNLHTDSRRRKTRTSPPASRSNRRMPGATPAPSSSLRLSQGIGPAEALAKNHRRYCEARGKRAEESRCLKALVVIAIHKFDRGKDYLDGVEL